MRVTSIVDFEQPDAAQCSPDSELVADSLSPFIPIKNYIYISVMVTNKKKKKLKLFLERVRSM